MTEHASVEQEWSRVRARLRQEVGEAAFRSWLQPVAVATVDGKAVRLSVPNRFVRDWVANHYADRITNLWASENPDISEVDLIIGADCHAAEPVAVAAPAPLTRINGGHRSDEPLPESGAEDEDGVSSPLDPRFTFDDFVVGKPNELAYAAARRAAESQEVPFNPLFLYGGVGLGKTHLMHAIGWAIKNSDSRRKVIYMSAEKFVYQFVKAIRYQNTMAFKEQFRSVDVLMIDDIQFICGKEHSQEEFFHTFNALIDQKSLVVISADKSPHDLDKMEERLSSRLSWGLVADIHPTTFELRLGILQSKVQTLKIDIPPKVLEFIAHRISSNVREVEGALNRIVAHAELVGREVTLEMAHEVLADLLRAHDRRVTVEEIQRKVAEHYNLRLADMASSRRTRSIARPRQVAMYLAKQLTQMSLPEIGRKFGGKDHTTVMHAVKRVEQLTDSDAAMAEDIELLRRSLSG